MNDAQELEAIADEIEQHPERWTQGPLAKDTEGDVWDDDDMRDRIRGAYCWCALGFCRREHLNPALLLRALGADAYAVFRLTMFNDAKIRTPADIVALFRKAAALARTEPGR